MKTVGKLIIGLLLVGLVATGGYALFTDIARSGFSRLEAGVLSVEVEGEPVRLSGIVPGDAGEVVYKVTNTGTMAANISVTVETTGGLFEGDNPVGVHAQYRYSYLDVGHTTQITVWWSFPEIAGDDYQGAYGEFEIVVHAEQAIGGYP